MTGIQGNGWAFTYEIPYSCLRSVVFRRINHEAQTAEDLVACRFAVGLRIILCEFETDDIDAAVGDENIGFAVLVCSHCHGVVIDDVGDDFSVWQRLTVVQYLYGQIIADFELGGIFQGNDLVRQIRQGSHLVDAFEIIDAVFDGMRAYGRAGNLIHWLVDVFAVRSFRPIAVVKIDDSDGNILRRIDRDVIATVNDFERNPRIGFIEADKHRDILWVISIVFVTFAEDELGLIQTRCEPDTVSRCGDGSGEHSSADKGGKNFGLFQNEHLFMMIEVNERRY